MATPYLLTKDGFESQMGTNHFGHFLFTALIYSAIVPFSASDPARIINTSSRGHYTSPVRFDDMDFSPPNGETYDKWKAYGQNKTDNLLFSNEIGRLAKEKGRNLVSFSIHPGGTQYELGIDGIISN